MSIRTAISGFFRSALNSQPEPPVHVSISISVPQEDAREDQDQALAPGSVAQAEGQSFVIQYRDAAGRDSLRRITVWGVKANADGVPVLVAKCHERKATRYFRVDRVQTVTDFDGVVRDPLSEFYRETFGFKWPISDIVIPEPDASDGRWNLARKSCRDGGVVLLSALALADGEVLPEELSEILNYAYDCCSKNGLELSDQEADRLATYIRRIRPTPDAVDRALDKVLTQGTEAVRPLLKAGARVIEADGLVHSDEIAALNRFSLELTGQGIW